MKDADDDGDGQDHEPDPVDPTATSPSEEPLRLNLPNDWLSEVDSLSKVLMQPFAQVLESREWLGRQVSMLASPALATLIEGLDKKLIAPSLLESAVASLGAVSHAALGESMITSTLAAKWASLHVGDLLGDIDVGSFDAVGSVLAAQVAVIPTIAHFVEHHNALLAQLAPSIDVAKSVTFATRAWQDVVRVTPEDTGGRYLTRFDIAGRATGWAVHTGILLTEEDEAGLEQMEAEAVVFLGPGVASAELRLRLSQINPALCDKLDGAWERIASGGSDAASQASNSLTELVDWTLRLLAPDADVLAWHAAEHRPAKELHEGRPTRTLRLRYAVRNQPEKNSTLDLYLRSVQGLGETIQGVKHSLARQSHRALTPMAMTIEGLLHFLLVD
jgi:hypothetical protein